VSPILGIFASQGRVASTSYESIATVTVGAGGASNVEFTSIPSTYSHLQIRGIFKQVGGDQWNSMQLNGDTASGSYKTHALYGQGSSAVAEAGNTLFMLGNGGQFSGVVIDILDYKNTNKYKTTRALYGYDANGSGVILFQSHLWMSTSAVTSVKLNGITSNFQQYSSFALYGIK
jgi:hypothetical protein